MKFDGHNFRVNHNIVMLRRRSEECDSYILFGRRVPEDSPLPADAKPSTRKWRDSGDPVMAVPIPLTGHSLTNMAYGADGRIYLAYDGRCYTAKRNRTQTEEIMDLNERLKYAGREIAELRRENRRLKKEQEAMV